MEDSSCVIVELESGAFGTIRSSWAQRVTDEDLVKFQIDGTRGSAQNGIRICRFQSADDTPTIRGFNLGASQDTIKVRPDYTAGWTEVPEPGPYINPYRLGWERFLSHVVADTPMLSDYAAGIRDVQLAEACIKSVETGKWISMDPIL